MDQTLKRPNFATSTAEIERAAKDRLKLHLDRAAGRIPEPERTPVGPPEAVGKYRCGHCAYGPVDLRHTRCPGAIDSGKSLWICPCGCKTLTCIACKSTEGVSPQTWRCTDRDECEATVAARVAKDPVIQMVRRLTEQAHAREVAERAARPAHPRPEVPRPAAGKCECGCGSETKSRFAMGHDARLRGVLQRAYAAGDIEAGKELAARGGIWAAKAPGVAVPDNPEAFVAARVAARIEAAS
jgi:hypothetical protein